MDLRLRHFPALVAVLAVALAVPAAQPDAARAEAQLKQATDRIQRLQRQIQQDEVEKNRQARELRDAERQVSKAQGELIRLREQRAETTAIRRHLESQKAEREAERERISDLLARQLRAVYFVGRSEPLKLLLNQRSPAEFSRNLTYYGYLGRLRAGDMRELSENIARIEQLTADIAAEDAKILAMEERQEELVAERKKALAQRGQVLARLERQLGNRSAELQRERQKRQDLERLVERAREATRGLAYDPKAPFARTKGSLSWPVAGKIIVNYGVTMPGGLKSEGIEIETVADAPVRAIHEGRVEFVGWDRGQGNLVFINHGNNYMSVYSHLDQLHVEGGARVAGGDTIGTAGMSGGRSAPGLFFQIRHAARAKEELKPLDPREWFRTRTPPAR